MIVIAADSFKGSLTAAQACEIIAAPLTKHLHEKEIVIKPVGDGGEGTARAMIRAAKGAWIKKSVTGPLPGMKIQAGFAWFEKDKTAVIEMAAASGLTLLDRNKRNPLKTTTFGTGELLKAAIEYGAKRVMLAVGGSATVDGGLGAAQALGWRFLDSSGNNTGLTGASLQKLHRIIKPENIPPLSVEVLCDVDNPLCGPQGAARIYAPQKGAGPRMVLQLEKGLENLADCAKNQLGVELHNLPGAGAAGGLAAGAVAFMNGTLTSGIQTVMKYLNLYRDIPLADWVITGEGSFDRQSLQGKVISGIAKQAKTAGTRVCVIAGQISVPEHLYRKMGIELAIPCCKPGMSADFALKNAEKLLRNAAENFAENYLH